MSKGQIDNKNNATKSSIKQQLRTDLGRSVGVTTATKLVWLTGLRAHLPRYLLFRHRSVLRFQAQLEISFIHAQ